MFFEFILPSALKLFFLLIKNNLAKLKPFQIIFFSQKKLNSRIGYEKNEDIHVNSREFNFVCEKILTEIVPI